MPSILWVKRLAGVKSAFTAQYGRKYTLQWDVATDTPDIDPLLVTAAEGLPRRGDAVSGWGIADEYALALEARAEQNQQNKCFWRVTCEFTSEYDTGSGGVGGKGDNAGGGGSTSSNPTLPENPTEEPAVFEVESKYNMVVMDQDYSIPTQKIRNSAGDPFESPLMKRWNYRQITYQKKISIYLSAAWDAIVGSTNKEPVTILPDESPWLEDRVYMDSYRVSIKQFRNGVEFYTVTAVFMCSLNGPWTTDVIDMGFRTKLGPLILQICDDYGQPVNAPRYLDGAGNRLLVGDPLYVHHFRDKPSVSWVDLSTFLGG